MPSAGDRCSCSCHQKGSLFRWGVPEVTDPVESLVACDLCAPLHAGVWRVVPRGYKPSRPNEPWRQQGDGEGDE